MDNASNRLTHVTTAGHVHMVDVARKEITERIAHASSFVACNAEAVRLLRSGELKKGDALAVARVAAIASVKKTPDLIPLCHPISITGVKVDITVQDEGVHTQTRVTTTDRTGIEMEALTAATTAALNIVDMIKAVDRGAHIAYARVDHKAGGRSGSWTRSDDGVPIADESATSNTPPTSSTSSMSSALPASSTPLVGVVTVSDRSYAGTRQDLTGPAITQHVQRWGHLVENLLTPDDITHIRTAINELRAAGAWLIITTGGTGITSRDMTPQAVAPLLDTTLPALTHAIQASGTGTAPGALLSRSIAGLMGRTAIITLPGSPNAVRDGLAILDTVREHLYAQLADTDH
ncbi:bifunctional molybdenum cofactor biosynthesis protein MoaC/MoaB [Populibacterium corticicola]|uniref:Bifunctional molybdenum cofactor biosynthesis protein MoaC/MoaB n=1 Tax=Populibacterium corticicola TaxID=1812826 RepID=A0ABW5XB45_9MICO